MDVTNIEYDVAIIGAGMIGSAAAKYASEDVKTSILIGPDQPQDGIHSGIQKQPIRNYRFYWLKEKKTFAYPIFTYCIFCMMIFVSKITVVQCNLDLVTLLVSTKTVAKSHNVTKSNDFM